MKKIQGGHLAGPQTLASGENMRLSLELTGTLIGRAIGQTNRAHLLSLEINHG